MLHHDFQHAKNLKKYLLLFLELQVAYDSSTLAALFLSALKLVSLAQSSAGLTDLFQIRVSMLLREITFCQPIPLVETYPRGQSCVQCYLPYLCQTSFLILEDLG